MKRATVMLTGLVFALTWAGVAWGDQDYTGASGGNYNTGANWSGGSVPTDEAAFIRNGATVTLDASEPNVTTLWLGGPVGDPSASGTLHVLSGASLTTGGSLVVGNVYDGTVVQSGGVINTPTLWLSNAGATGKSYYGLSGGTLTADNTLPGGDTTRYFYVGGGGGTGKFVQSGGYLRVQNYANINIGGGANSLGEVTMTNGFINQTAENQFNVGIDSAADNQFTMAGGSIAVPYKFQVGYGGTGTFTQSGGNVDVITSSNTNGAMCIGLAHGTSGAPNPHGVYNVNGGVLTSYGKTRIGSGYNATNGPAFGEINVNGGTLLTVLGAAGNQRLQIGYQGAKGILNVTAGSVGAYYDVTLADSVTSPSIPEGTLKVSGTGVVTVPKLLGGRAGFARIEVSGGSLASTAVVRVGGGLDGDATDPNCVGQMTVSGGSVTVGGNLSIGYKQGTGTVELSGGVLRVAAKTNIGDANMSTTTGAGGTFNMTGGKFEATGTDPVFVGYRGGIVGVGGPALGALFITGGTFRAPDLRMLNECDPNVAGQHAKLKIGANADVELSTQFRIYEATSEVEMEIASATKNSVLKSLGLVDLGTNKATLAVNTTGYRPREGDKFTLMTAPTSMTGSFSSITSNITLGLPGGTAFTGAIVGGSYEYQVTFAGLTAGDANGDHTVNGGDLALMGGSWMLTGQTWGTCDFTGDGKVDGGDLALSGGSWMWSLAPAPGAPLPEPATLALLALGALTVTRRRR